MSEESQMSARLPGVRYRTEQHERLVPHTIAGKERMVPEKYTVHIPVPPRDWDRIVLNAVTGVAVLFLAASVAWSTAGIGDLLARATVPLIAYIAAGVFDLAWIGCLALEWLARYDPDKAKAPRRAGHVALLTAMAAVCVHGWVEDSFVVGVASAAVAALAKGMWMLVLGYHARPLDPRTRAWLVQQDAEIGARLALAARLRHLDRVEGQHAALLAATAPAADHSPDRPDTDPDQSGSSGPASATVRSAVRAAATALPAATPQDITDHLSALGIDTDPDTVSALLTTDTPARLRPVGGSVKDSVRTAVASGITDQSAVLAYVRTIHGSDIREDTVVRYLRQKESA